MTTDDPPLQQAPETPSNPTGALTIDYCPNLQKIGQQFPPRVQHNPSRGTHSQRYCPLQKFGQHQLKDLAQFQVPKLQAGRGTLDPGISKQDPINLQSPFRIQTPSQQHPQIPQSPLSTAAADWQESIPDLPWALGSRQKTPNPLEAADQHSQGRNAGPREPHTLSSALGCTQGAAAHLTHDSWVCLFADFTKP